MRTSCKQDSDFIKEIIPTSLLEDAIEFIKNNFDAEELYGVEYLNEWALDNGYVRDDE